jgi:phosphate:Na+ symporter
MTSSLLTLLGGIGLFLFGMYTMTDALKNLAGQRSRQILAGFTRRPLSGAVTGALTTAAVQSSTATMLTTVGFVGAGLLSFPQALGILYGASIGTTITGWMVLLLGFKLQLTTAALPALFVAALVRVLTQGQMARAAMALAGLSLVFLGIDLMQDALAGYEYDLSPQSFPAATLAGRLQLVGIGVLVTLVTQSSSAGVVGTLVLLGGGAVNFEQAAAMVIGMHIGTTFTALLASVGGALAVRQTAVANLIYHVVSGVLAFFLIDAAAVLLAQGISGGDSQIGLVAFHTGFNLAGTAVMLPLTTRFAGLIEWLVPDRGEAPPAARLDRRLLADAGAALDTAAAVLRDLTDDLFAALAGAMWPGSDHARLAAARERVAGALDDLQDFLSRITIDEDRTALLQRYDAVLHQLDHLRRLHFRAGQGARLRHALAERSLRRHVAVLRGRLRQHLSGATDAAMLAGKLARLERRLGVLEARMRHITLRRPPHLLGMTAAELFILTDAIRWMRRSTSHTQRILHYRAMAQELSAAHGHGTGENSQRPAEPETPPAG